MTARCESAAGINARMDEARWLLSRHRVADMLLAIGLALPGSFAGLADKVARVSGQSRGAA